MNLLTSLIKGIKCLIIKFFIFLYYKSKDKKRFGKSKMNLYLPLFLNFLDLKSL